MRPLVDRCFRSRSYQTCLFVSIKSKLWCMWAENVYWGSSLRCFHHVKYVSVSSFLMILDILAISDVFFVSVFWLIDFLSHTCKKKDQKLIKTCIEMPLIYVTLYFTQVTITKQTAKNELDWKIKHNLWRSCESTGVTLFSDTDLFSYSLVSSNYRLQIY